MGGVWIRSTSVRDALGTSDSSSAGLFTGRMADVAFVLLTLGVFGLLALVVKGVERL